MISGSEHRSSSSRTLACIVVVALTWIGGSGSVLAAESDPELREAIEEAKRHRELYDRRTILFVDEVHRWNKSQQDALLPWVENGTVVLVGATTENPFF